MASMLIKDETTSCSYISVHPLALTHAYEGSSQCANIYSESGLWEHADGRIYST